MVSGDGEWSEARLLLTRITELVCGEEQKTSVRHERQLSARCVVMDWRLAMRIELSSSGARSWPGQ